MKCIRMRQLQRTEALGVRPGATRIRNPGWRVGDEIPFTIHVPSTRTVRRGATAGKRDGLLGAGLRRDSIEYREVGGAVGNERIPGAAEPRTFQRHPTVGGRRGGGRRSVQSTSDGTEGDSSQEGERQEPPAGLPTGLCQPQNSNLHWTGSARRCPRSSDHRGAPLQGRAPQSSAPDSVQRHPPQRSIPSFPFLCGHFRLFLVEHLYSSVQPLTTIAAEWAQARRMPVCLVPLGYIACLQSKHCSQLYGDCPPPHFGHRASAMRHTCPNRQRGSDEAGVFVRCLYRFRILPAACRGRARCLHGRASETRRKLLNSPTGVL